MSTSTPSRYFSPPEIAERFGVDPAKVVGWIRKGEMRAVNVGNGSSRPRYRISPADLATFEASRAVQPPAPRVRRRRTDPNVVQFF
jgi:excisionase family DNA binding protein